MRRTGVLWWRTVLFTILVPGTELVLIPLVVVGLGLGPRLELGPARYAGLVPLSVGLVVILRCFADFVRRGRGTPAPYDPPRELVVVGLYRSVRNPQYVGVVLVLLGEALLSGRVVLFIYAALMAVGYHLFVRYYEEPTLGRLFGEPYARYRAAVPRWLPRRPMRTHINGLPLPRDLLELINVGRWRLPEDRCRFDALFPEHGTDASFYSLDYMPFENGHWRKETARMFLGTPDPENPPGDIDPARSVLVADLGTGTDQPIALDYRTDPPRVLTLRWSQPPDEANRWVVVAPHVRAFAELVGLRA